MAGLVSWVSRQWRTGWEKIPVVMAAHCVTVPIMIGYIGTLFTPEDSKWRLKSRPQKYRATYTVMRSDDPRIKNINHYDSMDKLGVFS